MNDAPTARMSDTRWIAVGKVGDIPPGEGRSVDAAGRRLAVFATDTGHVATDAACPHNGGPLADGIVTGDCVSCPLHGWRIHLRTGRVVDRDERVRIYPVVEVDGELLVAVPAGQTDAVIA